MKQPADTSKVRQVELVISHLLRTGVIASVCIILVGTAVSFRHHPEYFTSAEATDAILSPQAIFPHTLPAALSAARAGKGQGIVLLGLLVLVATPVLRVAVSILGFVYERDWIFVTITSLVLLLLLLSFVLGRGEG
jgi:uncharacterized membrane protein